MTNHTRGKKTIVAFTALACAGLVPAAGQAEEQRVKNAPDGSWVSVSGTVTSTSPDSFKLDYRGGVITVEMDDFDFFAEGHQLLENDQVVVYGLIDDDLFERRTLEASSVYVENLNTHFYASSADEEDFDSWSVYGPVVVGNVEVTGVVTSISGHEFTVNTGVSRTQIDTSELPYNPLDDAGYFKIEVGDRVKVSGDIDRDLFEKREIMADWITEYER